jgi:hypothetical protein
VLFKLFFAKEYPTNKTLNTGNNILRKNDKSYFLEKKFVIKNCQNLNSNNLFKQNNSVAMVTIALPIFENIPI